MESASVRYLRTSCWLIRKRVSFLIQKQWVRKYCTKHVLCCNLFILYWLRFSPTTRFPSFIRQNKCQVMFLFCLSASTLPLLQNPSVNIFRTERLPQHQKTEVNLWKLYKLEDAPTTTWMRCKLNDSFWQLISYWMKCLSPVWGSRFVIVMGWRNFRTSFSCDEFYPKISVSMK